MSQSDVIIIGGGIIGAACADALVRNDMTVTVLDSGAEDGIATPAAGGMLAPLAESGIDDPLLSLSVLARDLYATMVPELQEVTGIDIGYSADGILQVAFDEDDVTHLKNDIAWKRQQGYNLDWVAVEEIRDTYPGLSEEVVGGKLAPEDGALEPEPLHQAFVRRAQARGATFQQGVKVTGVVVHDGRVTGCTDGKTGWSSEHVVVAAGAWSGRLEGLPRPLSVEPIRGQMLALDWPDEVPAAIVYSSAGYVLHRQGEALTGTTMEHVGFDANTTDSAVATILEAVRRMYPALASAQPKRQWAGLRPVTPDGLPMVGPDPTVPGLWYATGHGRNGVLLAALSARILGQRLLDEEIDHDLSPIDPARFWRL